MPKEFNEFIENTFENRSNTCNKENSKPRCKTRDFYFKNYLSKSMISDMLLYMNCRDFYSFIRTSRIRIHDQLEKDDFKQNKLEWEK